MLSYPKGPMATAALNWAYDLATAFGVAHHDSKFCKDFGSVTNANVVVGNLRVLGVNAYRDAVKPTTVWVNQRHRPLSLEAVELIKTTANKARPVGSTEGEVNMATSQWKLSAMLLVKQVCDEQDKGTEGVMITYTAETPTVGRAIADFLGAHEVCVKSVSEGINLVISVDESYVSFNTLYLLQEECNRLGLPTKFPVLNSGLPPAPPPPTVDGEHTGGSVTYYQCQITSPTTEGRSSYTAECNDIIEALDMTSAEANIFKEIWRSAAARTLGKKKHGHDAVYGAEKVLFFATRNLTLKQAGKR